MRCRLHGLQCGREDDMLHILQASRRTIRSQEPGSYREPAKR